MIDVGMGEDDRLDRFQIEAQAAIAPEGFVARPLVEAAVEEDPAAPGLQEVPAPGDAPGGAMEVELHGLWRL